MNVSASRSRSAVVTPGRTSAPSTSRVRATSCAASRIASISVRFLKYTIALPARLRLAQRRLEDLVDLILGAHARKRQQPPLGAVKVDHWSGLLVIHLEPLPHRILAI